jgi:hypothetical protein
MRWLLPILVLLLCEALAKTTTDRVPRWYGAAERIAEERRIDAIFVGSSRVQSAIPTDVFNRSVDARTGESPVALNLGRGYSTIVEHYLGLRNLVLSHPDHLHGVTVFIEAPGGVSFPDRWDGEWTDPAQYQLLVDLLRLSDLPELWRSMQQRSMKLKVTARFFARQSALINRRERLRTALIDAFSPGPSLVLAVGDDLQGPGPASSIRTDDAALHAARELAQQLATEFEKSTVPMRDWRGTVIDDLVTLLHRVDGHLVFFPPPESEAFRRGYRSSLRQEDAAVFAEQVRRWGACLVQPSFTYTDEDLPDLWHLRPERSPAFATTLTDGWLTQCRPRGQRAHAATAGN